ncbi:uncharacterized protein RHIMIDRAFT_243536 [Rhizopus microsporus ATCC 52813]|uniref:Uncharacterized protein n=1 Tax=Rhizopus microsporus ATCC 52813 TaxID=1340429 RepID=A0A2G4T8X9_RHIZD|nr:uncharacterized protein RHIMIDRAFT_243536 [Rhizopus microsporus ATCC 52813]PHZ17471.1 hypothetical protein RHIMIDRAFT_243536 [Rhizopus microsporus ATCC 52813]
MISIVLGPLALKQALLASMNLSMRDIVLSTKNLPAPKKDYPLIRYHPKVVNHRRLAQTSSSLPLPPVVLGGQYQAAKRVGSLINDLAVMAIPADIQENSKFLTPNRNAVRSQQYGHLIPVLLASFSPIGDLRLPGRSKKAKSSSGTAATCSQALSSGNIIHSLATSGAGIKRKIDAVTPTMANPKKKLKVVHQALQLMTDIELSKEPNAADVSFEIALSAATPMATVSKSPMPVLSLLMVLKKSRATFAPKFAQYYSARSSILYSNPLKITKDAVKQKKLISVLKGKDIVNFVPGLPRSVVHRTPSTSQPTVSLASAFSSTKGKDKEMPFHSTSGASGKELFTSKLVSDISAAPASNSSTTADIKLFQLKANDEELEEGEIVSSTPSSFPEQVSQACSKDEGKFYILKHNEAQVGESAFRPEVNNITTNANQSTRRTAPSDSECRTKIKLCNDKINDKPADASPTTTSVKRTLSATAPNANTMEQFKVITVM